MVLLEMKSKNPEDIEPVNFANGTFVNMTNADLEIGAGYCKINNNTVWHAGNDGARSGLDADLLDGQHGSFYFNRNTLFNGNNVDLNRNFDCDWQASAKWQNKNVSGGESVFSEPEAQAIKGYVEKNKPIAAIFWHSQSNAVYASECNNGILPETINIMNTYSFASGYSPVRTFDSYEITGDAEGWLASINIPAITVELKTHETIEWERNLAGFKAILEYYNK